MDGIKGIHALATSFLSLFVAYVAYDFVESFINSVSDTTLKYIFWGSYIIILLVCALAVPALIAFSEDSDASVLSMCGGLFFYFAGMMFMRMFHPIMTMFVGDGSSITGILATDTFGNQLMTFLYILGILFTLFIGPIVTATMPNMVQTAAQNAVEAVS